MKIVASRVIYWVVILTAGNLATGGTKVRSQRSRFGIDYLFALSPYYHKEVWSRVYSECGAGWVNFAMVSWGSLEPSPPTGGKHTYRWEKLDKSVRLWQNYGFRIVLSLRLGKGWFAGPIRYAPKLGRGEGKALLFKSSDRLPRDMNSYRLWIYNLVERYDGDGENDMPELRYPILHYQIGNEYSNPIFWSGSFEDYAVLLLEARRSARQACKEVKIISNGIRWGDLFHNDPNAEHFEETFQMFLDRLPTEGWREGWKRAREFTEKMVHLAGVYDILDAGGNGPHPTMSEGYMRWVLKELQKAGKKAVVWDMESRCEPLLIPNRLVVFHPELAVPGGRQILNALRFKRNKLHEQALKWYRAEQARILAKVFVTRFSAGFRKVFMGMVSDWNQTWGAFSTPNPYLGLLDADGRPWPAFYTFKLLVEKLDGFTTAEKVLSDETVEFHKFTFKDGRSPVWVAWLKESKVRGMNDPLPRRRVSLRPIRGSVTVWTIPTVGNSRSVARLEAGSSGLSLELTPTPVLIQ